MRRQFITTARDIIWVFSAFFIIAIFGGVEQGTIASWKLEVSILLVLTIDLAVWRLTKENKKRGYENAKNNE